MIHRCRMVWRRRNPEIAYRLQWTRPGSVWAADHSHVRGATKEARIAISCRDLGSHEQLLWEPSRETASVTVEQLRRSFEKHGPPLVFKADGGPSFRSDEMRQLLDEYGVELLPSPPYCPEYNGSCEAANQSMKKRTLHIAENHGRADAWLPCDLELGRQQANHTTRPWGLHGPVPRERWLGRNPIQPEDRERFRAICARWREQVIIAKELTPEQLDREITARCVQRAAVSRALVEHGLLIIRRRVVRPPIHTIRTA